MPAGAGRCWPASRPAATTRPASAEPGRPLLSVVLPYPAYPPEMVYPRTPQTDEPAIVPLEEGSSRRVYFPGDVDRSCWRTTSPDLSLLLANAIRWLLRGRSPVSVTGEGMAEIFAWRTEPGFAVHILSYNNPNMLRGWVRRNYPLGPQRVRFQALGGVRIGTPAWCAYRPGVWAMPCRAAPCSPSRRR